MEIVCCTDDNYVMPCGVLLTSLFENNREENITIHIITAGLEEKNIDSLVSIVSKYNQDLKFHEIDSTILSNCPIRKGDHVSLATYFRILIPRILPTLAKVLYLDCDMVVNASLKDLWNVNVDGYAIAAVKEAGMEDIHKFNILNYDRQLGYFNAGVLLINIEYWKKNSLPEESFEYINNYSATLKYHDQDTLNYVLRNVKKDIPLKYNATDGCFLIEPAFARKYWDELKEAINNPVIIHYTTYNKPWYKGYVHPYKSYFEKYKALTEWKDLKPMETRKGIGLLKSKFKDFMVFIGIKKRRRRPSIYAEKIEDLKIWNY